jgi:hypothetical protein
MLAELKMLRGKAEGWAIEKAGLQGQVTTLTRQVVIETERGDFYKKAAETLQQVDKNAQRMDTNSLAIQTTLETRITEKNEQIRELTDDLRSCQGNQKWIAGVSAVGGGIVGYMIRGQTDRFLGQGAQIGFRPTLALPQLEAPRLLSPFQLRK